MVVRRKKSYDERVKRSKSLRTTRLKKERESKLRKKPGGSNVGKYKRVAKGEFCGPSGGAPAGTYPVNSAKRCRAALAYARNAPNPAGIKKCVRRKCKDLIKKYSKKQR